LFLFFSDSFTSNNSQKKQNGDYATEIRIPVEIIFAKSNVINSGNHQP